MPPVAGYGVASVQLPLLLLLLLFLLVERSGRCSGIGGARRVGELVTRTRRLAGWRSCLHHGRSIASLSAPPSTSPPARLGSAPAACLPQISDRQITMGWESKPMVGGKRRRPAVDDEVYLDNFHTHKRYLSEVMASSLNGLRMGESAAITTTRPASSMSDPMASPAPTDTGCLSRSASSFPSLGDDLSTLDSPMSEDSDESVGYRMVRAAEMMQMQQALGVESPASPAPACPTSPPRRAQRVPYAISHNLPAAGSSTWSPMRSPYVSSHPLPCSRPRPSEPEGRLPPSPSDACQSADLRKAALLRALQRAQSPSRPAGRAAAAPATDAGDPAADTKPQPGAGDPDAQRPIATAAAAAEQSGCNSEVLGSRIRGQLGHGGAAAGRSSRVRSLLLGEQQQQPAVSAMATSSDTSLSSGGNEDLHLDKSNGGVSMADNSEGRGGALVSVSDRANHHSRADGSRSCSSKDGNLSDTESSFSRKSVRPYYSKTSATTRPSSSSRCASQVEGTSAAAGAEAAVPDTASAALVP